MPEIGRPKIESHPFQKIKKAFITPQNIGEELNRLSGVQEKNVFVEKNEKGQLDKNAFLRLLATQLQNQDPFSPMDQKKFASDLAQFSQLEQLAALNNQFKQNHEYAPHQVKFLGASFLGKEVLTKGASLQHDGRPAKIYLPFHLHKPAKHLLVRIFDQSQNLVAQVESEERGIGPQGILWDGYFLDGAPASRGTYRFEVTAYDSSGQAFKGATKTKGVVTGVSFEGSEVVLDIDGGKRAFLRDVDYFSLPGKQRLAEKNTELKKNFIKSYNKVNATRKN